MSFIQTPGFARSLVACAIASLSVVAVAQDANDRNSTEQKSIAKDDTIIVTATRTPTRYNQLIPDVTVVDRTKMQEYGPQAPITDVLANEPGVTVKSSGGMGGQSSVFIRGASNNQSVLLVDGLRVSSVANGGPAWAYIPMQQIGKMEIVRGPTSSSYGSDAIGGVIQLFTRKGEGPTKYYADAGYGTYGTSAETIGVEGSKEGFSYSIYGGNTHSLGLPSYTNASNYFNPNSAALLNSSASTRLAYTIAQGQEIGASVLYGNGNNSYTESRSIKTQNQQLTVASLYTQNKILEDWQSTIRIGQSVDNLRNYLAGGSSDNNFRSVQNQIQWQNNLKLPVGNGMLAYEYLEQKLDSNIVYSAASRNINSVQAGWNGDWGRNLFQLNVRNDNNSQFGNATTGSIGYGYFIMPSVRATASWGTGFRAPTFNELYWQASDPWGFRGNSNLAPERSQNTEGGIRYDDGTQKFGIIYYYNRVKNLIQTVEYYVPAYYSTAENVSNAVLQGLTASYGGKILGLDIATSYDYQDARNTTSGTFLAYRPANFGSMTVSKNAERWNLGGQMQVSGSQQSNPSGDLGNNNLTMGGYTLFNVFGSVNLIRDVSLFVRGNNIFNRQYTTNASGAPWTGNNYYRNAGSNFFVGLRFDTR